MNVHTTTQKGFRTSPGAGAEIREKSSTGVRGKRKEKRDNGDNYEDLKAKMPDAEGYLIICENFVPQPGPEPEVPCIAKILLFRLACSVFPPSLRGAQGERTTAATGRYLLCVKNLLFAGSRGIERNVLSQCPQTPGNP
jgi:hypothetical protein